MAKHRVGVLGGYFDPFHQGHLRMAQAALDGGYVDHVLVLPAGGSPDQPCVASPEDRWQMAVAACSVDSRLEVGRLALDRSDASLPVETLRRLHKQDPKADLYCIIGSDALMRLTDWRHPKELLKAFPFLVCPRPEKEDIGALRSRVESLTALGARLIFLPMDPSPAASCRIREGCLPEEEEFLNAGVREFISAKGLYHQEKRIARADEWLDRLFEALNPHRFAHSLSVAWTARHLAQVHGVAPFRAEEAGLLHDCAKCLPLKKMQQIAREHSLTRDPAFLESGALLHSLVGAWVARNRYGMADPEVLDAISYHNTGCPGMSRLAMCVCLADSIEPLRESFPLLEKVRLLAEKDLEGALLLSLEGTADYVQTRGKYLHPRTMQTIAWLKNL
ncbi:MAG: HD domain-containing protein [Clostridiales bacterium]|nr:HD domain-containing protein [Clostridiales bacterium]